MPQEIIDLDAILKPPKRVRIGGTVYKLPPGIPVEVFLAVNKAAAEDRPDPESLANLASDVLKLFQWGQPEMTALPPGMLLDQLLLLISAVYGEASEDDADPPSKGGTRSTSRKRSRSGS